MRVKKVLIRQTWQKKKKKKTDLARKNNSSGIMSTQDSLDYSIFTNV